MKKERNSSIELLRLVAMYAIVADHFALYTSAKEYIPSLPVGITKFVFQVFFLGGGWFGNALFFIVSVWFLSDRNSTVVDSVRRIWILERELLFWSISLLGISMFMKRTGVMDAGVALSPMKAVFPLATSLWWYPTCYAIFLLFLPVLSSGLRSIGRRAHALLAVIVLVIWSNVVPGISFEVTGPSVLLFLGWYVAVTYYKWYIHDDSRSKAWFFIGVGMSVAIAYWLLAMIAPLLAPSMKTLQLHLDWVYRTPALFTAFGVFLLANKVTIHSKVINYAAASSFGIYLIHCYPPMLQWWTHLNVIDALFGSQYVLLYSLLAILLIFLICLCLDMIRMLLFRFTCDKAKGHLFDVIRSKAKEVIDGKEQDEK